MLRIFPVAIAVMALTGCASFSSDGGFGAVESSTRTLLHKDIVWAKASADQELIRSRVKSLLTGELSVDAAVQVALLNNPGLQATYYELGLAEARLVQAGRLRNPGFTFSRLERHGEVEIERQFIFDLLGLLTMPARTRIEARRFEQAKLRVSSEVMRVAADTRRAWYAAVAAQQHAVYMSEVKEAAEAGAELAQHMVRAGNISKLNQSREQVFYAEVMAQYARAQQQVVAAREKLVRMLGVSGEALEFSLASRLPELPASVREIASVEQKGIEQRLDVQMARAEVDGLAQSLGLTKTTRFVNVLEASYLSNSASGEARQTGYEIELSIPLFDFGSAKVAHAEATYMQGVNRLAEIGVNARSELREAYSAYRGTYDLAKHYRDEIVPLRKQISEETLLRYNGMLISIFELLADARQQMASVNAYIGSLRDFWMAEADLDVAMTIGGTRGVTMQAGMVPEAAAGAGH